MFEMFQWDDRHMSQFQKDVFEQIKIGDVSQDMGQRHDA